MPEPKLSNDWFLTVPSAAAKPGGGDFVLTDPSEDVPDESMTATLPEDADDLLISDPSQSNKTSTRKILRPLFIPNNHKDATALVKATLMHQRRGSKAAQKEEEWEDADSFNLATLKAGEQVKLALSAGETKRLFLALIDLYKEAGTYERILNELGSTVVDGTDVTILRGREQQILKKLIEAEGEKFWDHVEELQPDLFKAVALRKQYETRKAALDEFENQLNSNKWKESEWERFFRENTWIFGFGLSYQFLTTVRNQPHYGGTVLTGKGAQRGDFLMATEADARFVVLVDIKKPNTSLLVTNPYRGQAVYRISDEVAGGVAQLQANCAMWSTEGSRSPENVRFQHENRLHTHEPKGILIVGHTSQFEGDDERVGSFERFRRNLHNPEILTFDELLERARYLVETDFDIARKSTVQRTT